MKQLAFVAAVSVVIVASVALHKNWVALTAGIVVGTWYFLNAVARGGGMAQLRITQDPGQPRKPGDPGASIGMGLAASGIAASVMSKPDYPESFHIWYACIFAGGIVIALAYAGKTMLTERRVRAESIPPKPRGGRER